jgi:tripartite-type tricarboxylate transporter receptor subunit TctC
MTLQRRSFLAAPALLVAPAMAQGRNTRIIVAFPPGGTADILARALAEAMTPAMDGPLVVENRPGAGTAIATEAAIRAVPDGRTLLVGGTSQVINQALKAGALPFDFARDLAPIGQFAAMPALIVAGPGLRAQNVPELIALARRQPGTLAFGSSGTGTSSHLAGLLFAQLAGLELLHVPHRGAAAAFTDLLGERLQLMFPNVPEVLAHLQSGRLRALAVAAPRRSSVLPDTPTAAEVGLPGFDVPLWLGLMAPAGTPDKEIQRVAAAMEIAMAESGLRRRWATLGAETGEAGPAALARLIATDIPRWAALVAASGAAID